MSSKKTRNKPQEAAATAHRAATTNGHHDDHQKKPKKRLWRDYEPIERFNLIIAIFTVIYSLIESRRSLTFSRQALEYAQQAFVYMKEIQLAGGGSPQGSAQWMVVGAFANSGLTQGRKTNIWIEQKILPKGQSLSKDFPYPLDSPQAVSIVAPKSSGTVLQTIPSNVSQSVVDFDVRFFVYGTIRYCDIFNVPHITDFCDFLNIRDTNPQTKKQLFDLSPCSEHNCADSDCSDYDTDSSQCQ